VEAVEGGIERTSRATVIGFAKEFEKSVARSLPPGEGGAKRRVRDLTCWKRPSSGPSGHLLRREKDSR
jgi:hypothetical protein